MNFFFNRIMSPVKTHIPCFDKICYDEQNYGDFAANFIDFDTILLFCSTCCVEEKEDEILLIPKANTIIYPWTCSILKSVQNFMNENFEFFTKFSLKFDTLCIKIVQWWSMRKIHVLQTLQWCALGGFQNSHFSHLLPDTI